MTRVLSFAQAERYLLGTIDELASRRTSYKLDRMRALMQALGDPHRAYPTIHVGGTSGKGSTCTMIAAALQAAGKRTALHTKPHLHSMTERARIDGVAIAPARFAAVLDEMMPALESTAAQHGAATYYETLLALAFTYFAQERVDVAVIEVGLGGRLDGTNVIVPAVAAITSIGYDHTEVLGETLEEIAAEKAGIAKRGVPLVVGAVPAPARAVIERHAARAGAPVIAVEQHVRIDAPRSDGEAQRIVLHTARARYAFSLAVLGAFQRVNAATAVAVLEQLDGNLRPAPADVERAFADLAIPGRMERLGRNPLVVLDIAHNAEKAEALVASLRERFAGRRVHYVVAIGESKDARRIIEILAAIPSTFTFTTFAAAGRHPIAPARLARMAEGAGTWGRAIADPVEALTIARRWAQIEDIVVVTGSTFVVAGLREWYGPAPV